MRNLPTVIVKDLGDHNPQSRAPEGIAVPIQLLLQECGYEGKYTLEVLAARIPKKTMGISVVCIAEKKIRLIIKPSGAETGRRCHLIVPQNELNDMFNSLCKFCGRNNGKQLGSTTMAPPRLTLIMMNHSPANAIMRDICAFGRQVFTETGYATLSQMMQFMEAILGERINNPAAVNRLVRDLLSTGLLLKKRHKFFTYHFILTDSGRQEFGLTEAAISQVPIVPITLETIVENRDTNEAVKNFRDLCKRVERYRYINERLKQITEYISRLENESEELLIQMQEEKLEESIREYEQICSLGKL